MNLRKSKRLLISMISFEDRKSRWEQKFELDVVALTPILPQTYENKIHTEGQTCLYIT